MIQKINPTQSFEDLQVPPNELRPSATLTTGQCFHWIALDNTDDDNSSTQEEQSETEKKSAWGIHNATDFIGTIRINRNQSMVIAVRETPTTTLYRPLTSLENDRVDLHQALRNYFQLDISIATLYKEWSAQCRRLQTIAKCIPGVRMIDQDPWECLVSFICSSNNNIPRITKMLSAIRKEYGRPLLTIANHTIYSFPSLQDLLENATENDLRTKCGMGYRAKYLMETMKILNEKGGEDYLWNELRTITDPVELQTKLCEFCGVGPKVADCVALFSLRQDNAIPVDTHVWNIALRDYDPDGTLRTIKSLTPKHYQLVGDIFRQRFPNRAGWAHSLLFVAELPSFRPALPKEMVEEMDSFRLTEQESKKSKKKQK
jgi:N-glycosylase/DNA lyase